MIKPGAVVKYSRILEEGEEKFRFLVRECTEKYVEMECLNGGFAIRPIERVRPDEVVATDEQVERNAEGYWVLKGE
jgi:hypothetical protein